MKEFGSLTQPNLIWKQPKFAVDHFELRSDEDLYAELYWTKWLSDQAVARCASNTWTMDRVGFFRQRVIAIQNGTGREMASFEFDWLKDGQVCMADGRVFQWYRTKVFSNAWAMVDGDGELVFEIQFGMRWFKQEASVSLRSMLKTPAVEKRDSDLGLLLCLAFYIGYCSMQDAAGFVAATSAATAA